PQHAVEISGSASLDYRYNLIENGGTVAGSHLNYLQWTGQGVTDSALVEFNTTYQTVQAAGPGEGFQFYSNGYGTMANPTFAYNPRVAPQKNSTAVAHQTNHTYSVGDVITGSSIGGQSTYYICTVAGTSASSAPTYSTTGNGQTINDGSATFIGQSLAMSYMVHGNSGLSTSLSGTGSFHDNYLDYSGTYASSYPNSLTGWSIYNDYNMTTGALLPGTTASTAAPTIASFSPDSGVAGDGIPDANVFTLTGTAAAGS